MRPASDPVPIGGIALRPIAGGGVALAGADRAGSDRGSVTVEAAMALASLVLVVAACLGGIGCMIGQVRCADAAREAARMAGRGDEGGAAEAVAALAPGGATLALGGSGDLVTATVTAGAIGGLIPGVTLRATATAAREPGAADQGG